MIRDAVSRVLGTRRITRGLDSLILAELKNIQNHLENPFDRVCADDIVINAEKFVARLASHPTAITKGEPVSGQSSDCSYPPCSVIPAKAGIQGSRW